MEKVLRENHVNRKSKKLYLTFQLYRCYDELEAPSSCNTTVFFSLRNVRTNWLRYHHKVHCEKPGRQQRREDLIRRQIKQLNNNVYNDLGLAQYDTVCFQIIEKSVTGELPNGCNLRASEGLNKKFQPMIGASKTIIRRKSAKSVLYDVTRDPEEWISKLELLRGDLRKLGFIIDDVEMVTQIPSNLPKEHDKFV